MEKKNNNKKGWKGIGRALVLASTGPQDILQTLAGDDVVAIHLAGTPAQLMKRRTLAPELVDVVVIDATHEDRDEMVELGRVLRARCLGAVLVVPRDAWGQRMFRSYLSVFSHEGAVKAPHLWTAVSLAAQTTWGLAWLRLDRQPRRRIEERTRNSAIDMQSALLSKTGIQEVGKSRTEPWTPSANLLMELARAYNDEPK